MQHHDLLHSRVLDPVTKFIAWPADLDNSSKYNKRNAILLQLGEQSLTVLYTWHAGSTWEADPATSVMQATMLGTSNTSELKCATCAQPMKLHSESSMAHIHCAVHA